MDFEEIYQQIAQNHGVSVQEVKEEMQKAISAAWTDAALTEAERRHQCEVLSAERIPTPDELIRHILDRVKKCSRYRQ